jgi:hypothetical protein
VAITSEEARTVQFAGSADAYDGTEVEEFRRRVVAALAAHEAATPSPAAEGPGRAGSPDLAAAQRVRHQAVALAERMMREVLAAAGESAAGVRVWQEAAMLRITAEEELEHAGEEVRRLEAMARVEHDRIVAEAAASAAHLQTAAASEAESRLAAANSEAQSRLAEATREAAASHERAAHEVRRLEGRLEILRATVAEAERRFRSLAAAAANEVGTLATIVDADLPEGDTHVHLDLTGAGLESRDPDAAPPAAPSEATPPARNPNESFYQRRLAGLRERLERSGNRPEE